MAPFYRFTTTWRIPARPAAVFAALADVERYDGWWPQIRAIDRIDDDTGRVWIRGLLPYTLELMLRREVEDPGSGQLQVAVRGHLHGWSSWHLRPGEAGTTHAAYTQEVELRAPGLRQASFALRPLLRLNHAAMMRDGERGLRSHVAG
jgi:hypothetical protein